MMSFQHTVTFFNHVFNLTVGPMSMKVKYEGMSLEGMRFILNGPDYLYMCPVMEFKTCVT